MARRKVARRTKPRPVILAEPVMTEVAAPAVETSTDPEIVITFEPMRGLALFAAACDRAGVAHSSVREIECRGSEIEIHTYDSQRIVVATKGL